ncbi:hypothetical protein JTB14_021089 [Gonioctena quinquepunctata]|nr:hypothetical protein JTB14_021089 [Gonioctena quinquepunctata]
MQQDFAETRVRRKKKMPDELCEDESVDWTPQVRYKVDTFTLILDRLSTDFNERFLKNEWLLKALVLLDPKRFDEIKTNLVEFREPFSKLCYLAKCEEVQIIEELTVFSKNFSELSKLLIKESFNEKVHEYHIESEDDEDEKCVKNKSSSSATCKNCKTCFSCVFFILYQYNFHGAAYKNLSTLYQFVLTLSCTQVQCERIFSKSKIIKNRLRASMGNELLESLIIISIFQVLSQFLTHMQNLQKKSNFC